MTKGSPGRAVRPERQVMGSLWSRKRGGSLKDFQERSSLLQCASLKGSLCKGLEWVGCGGRLKIEGFYIYNYD